MKVIFATYGSIGNYVDAGLRLIKQAKSLKVFTETYLLTDSDLRLQNQKWQQWSSRLEKQDIPNRYHQAGKAFLIQHLINDKCQESDVIMYADVGCELVNNSFSRIKIKKLINLAKFQGGIAEHACLMGGCCIAKPLAEPEVHVAFHFAGFCIDEILLPASQRF